MKTKTIETLIKVIYAIATISVVVGLILRLLDYHDGNAISIIGLMLGLIAFILSSYKNKIKNKSVKVIYAIATIFVVSGLILRFLNYHDWFTISIIGLMIGSIAFILTVSNNKKSAKEQV